jgi:phage terminase large subunit
VPTVNAVKPIATGIEAVQSRLRTAGDGRPRLFVLRDSLVDADLSLCETKRPYMLEQEFDTYSWPKTVDGKPVKESPVDCDNHALDALRYGVMYLDGGVRRSPAIRVPHRASRRDMLRRV